ncbi:hypothetical protein OESDEN_00593 [Oesophagostomum dentatum]|uniref:glucuronosyltransferase n=1 Tax=Oesophagostomum dentatum TaxID=61180 RepID=A0A0B1TPC2_OESDE|nr:hypothetical protein OESDEN_00593 [Oesophagostomum dentatum]
MENSSQPHSTVYLCHREHRFCQPSESINRPDLYKGLNKSLVRERFQAISKNFPQLHWSSLVTEKFILVSFGSLAQAEYMPLHVAEKLLYAFSRSPFKVIWQTNSPLDSLEWAKKLRIPPNVILIRWTPLKEILAHPNLQYLICHGGINTINELLLFGVPVIGVYLQVGHKNVQRVRLLLSVKLLQILSVVVLPS